MAKLRKNHDKKQSEGIVGMITKGVMFLLLAGAAYFGFNTFLEDTGYTPTETTESNREGAPVESELDIMLPTSTTGQIVKHKYYALSYNEKFEVPEWVAYELNKKNLVKPYVSRTNDFRRDPKVKTGSAEIYDYKRSGYDRGHLVAAADMAFSQEAMSETFFLSNMTPQVHVFNTGIWRELEEDVRDWAKKFKHLYVVTGPVLTQKPIDYIGDNDVAVPESFYKVILDLSEPELKAIAFVIPNRVSFKRLNNYATTIDEVEDLTGIDFFPELLGEGMEKELEGRYDLSAWDFSDYRYDLRVKKWNKDTRN